jgi:ATP/maltotriose-dependent transcriptional regulator MalT
VLRGLALHAVVTCRFPRAEDLGRELTVVGQHDHSAWVEGEYVLGVTAFWRGDFAVAERHLSAAIDGYRVEDAPLHVARYAQDPLGVCLSRLALTQLFRGRPDDADRTIGEALRVAAELDNPMTVCYVRAFDAILTAFVPEHGDLGGAVAALDTITTAMHLDYFAIVARLLAGWRDICAGDPVGVAALRRAGDDLRREQPLHLTLGLSFLARAYRRTGDPASGRTAVAEALDATERSGQRYLLAELLRIDAELLALSGDEAGAVDGARQAVDAAVAMGSPWLRDRAVATLARISRRG